MSDLERYIIWPCYDDTEDKGLLVDDDGDPVMFETERDAWRHVRTELTGPEDEYTVFTLEEYYLRVAEIALEE